MLVPALARVFLLAIAGMFSTCKRECVLVSDSRACSFCAKIVNVRCAKLAYSWIRVCLFLSVRSTRLCDSVKVRRYGMKRRG